MGGGAWLISVGVLIVGDTGRAWWHGVILYQVSGDPNSALVLVSLLPTCHVLSLLPVGVLIHKTGYRPETYYNQPTKFISCTLYGSGGPSGVIPDQEPGVSFGITNYGLKAKQIKNKTKTGINPSLLLETSALRRL